MSYIQTTAINTQQYDIVILCMFKYIVIRIYKYHPIKKKSAISEIHKVRDVLSTKNKM